MNQGFAQSTHSPNYGQRLLRRIVSHVIDVVLPEQCGLCGQASDRTGYCGDCVSGLDRHARQCRICGAPFSGDEICGRCQIEPPPITETIAPFKYAAPISDTIHALKYRRRLACGRDLGYLLASEVEKRISEVPEVLVPVPLHWKRQFWRGFNQSVEIARPVSRWLGIPIDLRLVRRKVHTAPQVGLMPLQRGRNVQGAFQPIGTGPSSVAIIDDVMTSGSTTAEVARCLAEMGVRQIYVWTLARV
jgi:ComF family protein